MISRVAVCEAGGSAASGSAGGTMKSGAIWMELHALHKHGWTISALAREFGLNWRTVKRELESGEPRRYSERAKPTALTAAQQAHVERRLAVCPTLRGTDLHGELVRDYEYTGSYPAFARHLRALRPAEVRDPEIRFETDPGVQTQADWAILGTWSVDGETAELSAMVAILGCSRAPAVWFDQCAVLGTVPKACRPYRAQTKGKVERMVREVKESLVPWLSGQVLPP